MNNGQVWRKLSACSIVCTKHKQTSFLHSLRIFNTGQIFVSVFRWTIIYKYFLWRCLRLHVLLPSPVKVWTLGDTRVPASTLLSLKKNERLEFKEGRKKRNRSQGKEIWGISAPLELSFAVRNTAGSGLIILHQSPARARNHTMIL